MRKALRVECHFFEENLMARLLKIQPADFISATALLGSRDDAF